MSRLSESSPLCGVGGPTSLPRVQTNNGPRLINFASLVFCFFEWIFPSVWGEGHPTRLARVQTNNWTTFYLFVWPARLWKRKREGWRSSSFWLKLYKGKQKINFYQWFIYMLKIQYTYSTWRWRDLVQTHPQLEMCKWNLYIVQFNLVISRLSLLW